MKFFIAFALIFISYYLVYAVYYLRRIAEALKNLACDDEEDVEESEANR
jgi:hypothetical protein